MQNTKETLCKHCDHFVGPNPVLEGEVVKETFSTYCVLDNGTNIARYIHWEDGEQEFDHDAEPGEAHTSKEWAHLRPDLTREYPDGKIGPNSIHHSRRGKVDE